VWKWGLHTSDEVEAMQWHTGAVEQEVELVEGHDVEVGLHYRDESSSMRGLVQTQKESVSQVTSHTEQNEK